MLRIRIAEKKHELIPFEEAEYGNLREDRNHDAVMRIGGEAPRRRAHGQDHGFANKVGLSFIEFGEDCARSRFGAGHDVARKGCRGPRRRI
jgi:hypothetical protein